MSRLPILANLDELLNHLSQEERAINEQVASLESEIRRFEDIERPAYEEWLRLELGPKISVLEELLSQIHERRILVHRLNELIEANGLHPREALYVLRNFDRGDTVGDEAQSSSRKAGSGWNEDEIEARRRAKREAKREARREKKKAQKDEASPKSTPSPNRRLMSLYRDLAKLLHPDSPVRARHIPDSRLLNLWIEVQKAYDTANLERLLSIATWLSSGGSEDLKSAPSGLTYSERLSRLRTLRKAHRKLEERIGRLQEHPAWGFSHAKPQHRRKVRQNALRALDEEIAESQEILDELDHLLESIGPPRPPKRKVRR